MPDAIPAKLEGYYPGGRDRVRDYSDPAARPEPLKYEPMELGHAQVFEVDGVDTPMYTIGQLAGALNRQAGTLRKWETDKILPGAPFVSPSASVRGQRRLYTREHIEGLAKILSEEGLMTETWKPIRATNFRERAAKLFEELG